MLVIISIIYILILTYFYIKLSKELKDRKNRRVYEVDVYEVRRIKGRRKKEENKVLSFKTTLSLKEEGLKEMLLDLNLVAGQINTEGKYLSYVRNIEEELDEEGKLYELGTVVSIKEV